jgi:hypothetical protein
MGNEELKVILLLIILSFWVLVYMDEYGMIDEQVTYIIIIEMHK